MQNYNEEDFLLIKKPKKSRLGKSIIIIIILGALGFGGYYLYKNHEKLNLNIKLPWTKKEEKTEKEEKTDNDEVITEVNSVIDGLEVPQMDERKINTQNGPIIIKPIGIDSKGYALNIEFQSPSATLYIEKILIDGLNTSETLELKSEENELVSGVIHINKTELEPLNIHGFSELTIFYRVNTPDKKGNISREVIKVYNNFYYDNKIKGLIQIYEIDNFTLNYYKKEEDNDSIYLYFDAINKNYNEKKVVKLKKILINDELYNNSSLEEEIYLNTEKIFYITIPKKDIKNINNFTIQFFVIGKDKKEQVKEYFITNEYNKKF